MFSLNSRSGTAAFPLENCRIGYFCACVIIVQINLRISLHLMKNRNMAADIHGQQTIIFVYNRNSQT